MDAAALKNAGFAEDADGKAAQEKFADDNDLHSSGRYNVLGVWTRGPVRLMFEQNTASEPGDGVKISVEHPAVCVISGPTGKVACAASDTDLILAVAADVE